MCIMIILAIITVAILVAVGVVNRIGGKKSEEERKNGKGSRVSKKDNPLAKK